MINLTQLCNVGFCVPAVPLSKVHFTFGALFSTMYQLLSENSTIDCQSNSSEEGEKLYVPRKSRSRTTSRRWLNLLFLLSVLMNFALPIYFLHTPKEEATLEKSKFGMWRNIPKCSGTNTSSRLN